MASSFDIACCTNVFYLQMHQMMKQKGQTHNVHFILKNGPSDPALLGWQYHMTRMFVLYNYNSCVKTTKGVDIPILM